MSCSRGKFLGIVMLLSVYFHSVVYTQDVRMCGILDDRISNEHESSNTKLKLQRLRALCDAIRLSQSESNNEKFNSLPDSNDDMNNRLRRFRRSHSFLHFHQKSSSSSVRSTTTSRATLSSSKRFHIFNPFRSDSRTSSGPTLSTSTKSSHFHIFHRHSTPNNNVQLSTSASITSTRKHRVPEVVRNLFRHSTSTPSTDVRSDSSTSTKKSHFHIFHRHSTPNNNFQLSTSASIISTRKHRVPEVVRNFFRHSTSTDIRSDSSTSTKKSHFRIFHRHSTSTPSPGDSSTFLNLPKTRRNTTRVVDRFGNTLPKDRVNTSRIIPRFRSKDAGNKTKTKWKQAGKKYLPPSVHYTKQYHQQRKHSTPIYNDIDDRYEHRLYDDDNNDDQDSYVDLSETDDSSTEINEEIPTVFYCQQKDIRLTLIDGTLDDEGVGKCNIFNQVVTCPIEIECEMSEANDCCEDEYGTPFCCNRFVSQKYISHFHGHRMSASTVPAASINITIISFILVLICL